MCVWDTFFCNLPVSKSSKAMKKEGGRREKKKKDKEMASFLRLTRQEYREYKKRKRIEDPEERRGKSREI